MGSKLHFVKSIALLLTLLYVGCARLRLLFATARKQSVASLACDRSCDRSIWSVRLDCRVWPAVFVGAALANYDNGTALPTSDHGGETP